VYAFLNNTLVGWQVIYDFNLQEGDFFSVPTDNGYSALFKVLSVETTTAGDFTTRKQRLALLNTDSTSTGTSFDILEGIGNIGIFTAPEPFCSDFFTQKSPFCEAAFDGFNTEFICFAEGTKSYAPYPQCTVVDAPEPNLPPAAMQITPNPASDQLAISVAAGHWILGLQLHDLHGRVVAEAQALHTNAYSMPVADLPNGMYALSVRTDQGVRTELVILQKK
jgi:hypothetical protein